MPQSTTEENTQQPLHSNIAPEWETLRQNICHLHKCKRRARQLENKKDNTITKVVPSKAEIKHLESIAISLVKEDPDNKLKNYLWEGSCATYSIAMAWK